MKNESTPRDSKDLLEMFEKNYTSSEDTYSNVKKRVREDLDFSNGKQWDEAIERERTIEGKERPCLTINKIDPVARRIVNEAKQQKLELKVKPVDDKADPNTALILAGAIRNIEYQSNAIRHYMWAYDCMVRSGLGYFRIDAIYEDIDSFDMSLKIGRIRDPLAVSFDPGSEEQNGCDANFAIVSDEIFPEHVNDIGQELEDSKDLIGNKDIWTCKDGKLKVSEMQYKVFKDDVLYLLADGSKVKGSEVDAGILAAMKEAGGVVKERKIKVPEVHWAQFVGGKVFAKSKINSQYITIIRMVGREAILDGKVDYKGITRNSADSNRMYNVMSSLLVERIGLAPRDPYIGAAGAFEGYEKQWDEANRVPYTRLEYNIKVLNGVLAPPPTRAGATSGDPTIEKYLMMSSEDIKATSGLYDASLGNEGNETSGVAIKARASQGNLTTYDLLDNCANSIEHGGKVLLDMLPRVTTKGQLLRILGDDYKEKIVKIGVPFKDEKGAEQSYNFGVGKYDVEIDVGAGDVSRREFAVETLGKIISKASPEQAALIMDVLVSNLDIKDAEKIANRFKAVLPPQVIAAEEKTEQDNPELDALEQHATQLMTEMKAQMAELEAQMLEYKKQAEDKKGELDIKQQEVDIKRQEMLFKEREASNKDNEKVNNDSIMSILNEVLQKVADNAQETDALHEQIEQIIGIMEKGSSPSVGGSSPQLESSNEGGTQAQLEENGGLETEPAESVGETQ